MAYWTYQAFQIIKPFLSVTESYVAAYSLGAFLKFGNAVNSKTSINTTSLNVKAMNATATILSF